ncbi:hypothetical protein ALNOE001_05100 [Candidatus Methanobinarius endosymbioticus]|uniref:DUF447 family protein n=1 Tax=Candidatus Methanobinarius endosymbioticus TaxID=2006182 RepID=A0A366ME89_9EURY|nr:hypothetical protein ALNOE001_05100 [Candidatus Methanobinarius endosymbioticus]
MNIDLDDIGMEKGLQYEAIITTIDDKGSKNAAPIGIICKAKNKIMCRIFEGSTTLSNIVNQKEFIVNISSDPVLFTFSTVDNTPENLFEDSNFKISNFNKSTSNNFNYNIPYLKGVDAYFKCHVENIKDAVKKSDPVNKSEAKVIISEVEELMLCNKCAKAPNRGFYSLIESLVNFTRIDLVGDDQKDYFLGRFKESQRVINKVGSEKDKEAIKILGKTLNNKGYKTD